jgi:hypothetical protein
MEQHKTERPVVLTTGTSVSDQPSWLSSLCAQVRESYAAFRNPPPPIHVTARLDPDGVRELWGKRRYRAQILSFAV